MIAQLVYVVTKWPTLLTVYTLKIRHLKMLQQHSCVTGFFRLEIKLVLCVKLVGKDFLALIEKSTVLSGILKHRC